MKLLLVDYLASLKERDELDAMLPDLLTELGYNVISRPRRGTTQRGVDIAAVRKVDGEERLYLFSVKAGDLTRTEWNGAHLQALRPSLDEIRDSYLNSRVPPRYKTAKVVICLVFGGEIREDIRDQVAGYITTNTTSRISFEEWNGGRLADLLLDGMLREQVLPEAMRVSFRKAVALVDEPETAYHHFRAVAAALLAEGQANSRARVRSARQLSLCAWIVFVWARGAGNVEAAYRASELALLYVWELRRAVAKPRTVLNALDLAVHQVADLHMRIASDLIETKLLPLANVPDGLSLAVRSRYGLDINLALFDALGRLGSFGLWLNWMAQRAEGEDRARLDAATRRIADAGLAMVANNPALWLPVSDDQATDLAIFLQLVLVSQVEGVKVAPWIDQMMLRLVFTLRRKAGYPTSFSDYRDLVEHPRDDSDAYFKEATTGSTLIPLLCLWARALGLSVGLRRLSQTVAAQIPDCTQQLWTPDHTSEEHLYRHDAPHGYALTDLPIDATGDTLFQIVSDAAVAKEPQLSGLSVIQAQLWPILLVACRHHRLPVPPGFWVQGLAVSQPEDGDIGDDAAALETGSTPPPDL
jgi:hypothetical protein